MFKILFLFAVLIGLGLLVHYGKRDMAEKAALEDEETTDDNAQEREFEPVPLMPLEAIFALRDPSDFAIALNRYLCEKCDYDENMHTLSAAECVFYITMCLESEVNNGGFSQFFFNSGGNFANELVSAFTEIGAVRTAEICRRAVSIYGERVPDDREARERLLLEHQEVGCFLDACDAEFYQCEEDLLALRYSYVMTRRSHFT